jgi:hypothetical protein
LFSESPPGGVRALPMESPICSHGRSRGLVLQKGLRSGAVRSGVLCPCFHLSLNGQAGVSLGQCVTLLCLLFRLLTVLGMYPPVLILVDTNICVYDSACHCSSVSEFLCLFIFVARCAPEYSH